MGWCLYANKFPPVQLYILLTPFPCPRPWAICSPSSCQHGLPRSWNVLRLHTVSSWSRNPISLFWPCWSLAFVIGLEATREGGADLEADLGEANIILQGFRPKVDKLQSAGQIWLPLPFYGPRLVACGILVPRPGIEPVPPAVEAQSLNHWTAREVLTTCFWK